MTAPVGRTSGGPAWRALKQAMAATGTLGWAPRLAATLERVDPALRVVLSRLPDAPPMALVAVYRRRNASIMARVVAAMAPGSRVALWALDEIAPELRAHTCGIGPGARFALLNACVRALPARDGEWLVVSDDDVAFRRGDPASAVRIAHSAALHLSQPAHAWGSNLNWNYTRRRWLGIARRGRFVEIGPVFLLSPVGRGLVLPLPEDAGMGWGTEAVWAALEERGLRLGVIDAVLIDHLVPMATDYDVVAERGRESVVTGRLGVEDLNDLQHDRERWTLLSQLTGRRTLASRSGP